MKPSRVLHICNSSTKKAKIKASEATLEFTGSSDYTVEVLPQKKKKKIQSWKCSSVGRMLAKYAQSPGFNDQKCINCS